METELKVNKTADVGTYVGIGTKLKATFGGCETCPVYDYCDYRALLTKFQQEEGCNDIRRIYFENMRQWKRPITVLIRTVADIQTRIQLQQFIDGKDKKLTSEEWHRLQRLKLDVTKEIMKYDPEANQYRTILPNGLGAKNIIEMDPEMYNKDFIPDIETTKKEKNNKEEPEDE